jgi:hypothetical protein
MTLHPNLGPAPQSGLSAARSASFMTCYLDTLTLVERLHRLLLDVCCNGVPSPTEFVAPVGAPDQSTAPLCLTAWHLPHRAQNLELTFA